jgi:hypothetical protein
MTLRVSRRTEFIRRRRVPSALFTDRLTLWPGPRRIIYPYPIHTPFKVGKYLVSPLTRPIDGGRFLAAVSIRSGAGSMTHDLRFDPVFATQNQATRFVAKQALARIGWPTLRVNPATSPQE